jgi:periplasmic protein CpxP/Spy
MKRIKSLFINSGVRALAAGVFAAGLALIAGSASAVPASSPDRVEARIQDMRAKLKITTAQEEQWKAVAQVMRDNGTAIEPLIQDREEHAKTMTAIDDLNSYARIASAHADGMKRFASAFATLYASLSDAQKMDADMLFRNGVRGISKAQ